MYKDKLPFIPRCSVYLFVITLIFHGEHLSSIYLSSFVYTAHIQTHIRIRALAMIPLKIISKAFHHSHPKASKRRMPEWVMRKVGSLCSVVNHCSLPYLGVWLKESHFIPLLKDLIRCRCYCQRFFSAHFFLFLSLLVSMCDIFYIVFSVFAVHDSRRWQRSTQPLPNKYLFD